MGWPSVNAAASIDQAPVSRNRPEVSFVIPCYRSERTVMSVVAEIERTAQEAGLGAFEVVCVVDGSPDNVFAVLAEAARLRPWLRVVEFGRNFGQTNARMAGYRMAQGRLIVTLDDDGQCPVDQTPKLLAALNEGADLAVAEYGRKHQSGFKNLGSAVNTWMARKVIGLPEDFTMSNFFAFDRMVLRHVVSYEGPYPYLSGLLFQATDRVALVPMSDRPRMEGSTGYTLKKLLRVWMNGFTNFSIAPLRIAFAAGGLFALLFAAFLIAGVALGSGLLLLAALVAASTGALCAVAGMVGEYVGRVFMTLNRMPQYVVRTVVNAPEGDADPHPIPNERPL